MNRIDKRIRNVARTATHYPAVVVDLHGAKASARLSTNGATIHNIGVVGGPVEIGDAVIIDYSTPEPTIISTSGTWLTQEDLDRALAKLKQIEPEKAVDEYPYFWVFQLDDIALAKTIFQMSEEGWQAATDYCWDLWINDYGWPDIVVRWPPGVIRVEGDEQPYEYYDGGIVASHVGESQNSVILNNMWATQVNGQRFENITFKTVATYYWLTSYNFYWWYQTPSAGTNNEYVRQNPRDWYNCIFRNCLFSCEGYPEDKQSLTPDEYDDGIPYANHWIGKSNTTDEVDMFFYDCEFYSRANPSSGSPPHAVWYEWNADYDDPDTELETYNIYLYNCIIDCGDEPFSDWNWGGGSGDRTQRHGKLNVYAYNCQFKRLDGSPADPTTMPLLTILDDGDRSPVGHFHTSGSSGGYDVNAIHVDEAGEW